MFCVYCSGETISRGKSLSIKVIFYSVQSSQPTRIWTLPGSSVARMTLGVSLCRTSEKTCYLYSSPSHTLRNTSAPRQIWITNEHSDHVAPSELFARNRGAPWREEIKTKGWGGGERMGKKAYLKEISCVKARVNLIGGRAPYSHMYIHPFLKRTFFSDGWPQTHTCACAFDHVKY